MKVVSKKLIALIGLSTASLGGIAIGVSALTSNTISTSVKSDAVIAPEIYAPKIYEDKSFWYTSNIKIDLTKIDVSDSTIKVSYKILENNPSTTDAGRTLNFTWKKEYGTHAKYFGSSVVRFDIHADGWGEYKYQMDIQLKAEKSIEPSDWSTVTKFN